MINNQFLKALIEPHGQSNYCNISLPLKHKLHVEQLCHTYSVFNNFNYIQIDQIPLKKKTGGATQDLAVNETLHCAMARYGGPAIFHQ